MIEDWIERYERAWRTAGTEPLRALFTEEAVYRMSPYEEPFVGLERIAEMWDAEREGPDEAFDMTSEVVAVDGDTAVARVEIHYGAREYRDLWVIKFAEDGRATEFEEWPYWPGQPLAAPR
ncbi:MAG TPA: nuclear transport factor 2 family protein [Thermoleophilaceae bacterium]